MLRFCGVLVNGLAAAVQLLVNVHTKINPVIITLRPGGVCQTQNRFESLCPVPHSDLGG